LLAHLSESLVAEGKPVEPWEIVAKVGNSGGKPESPYPYHLHVGLIPARATKKKDILIGNKAYEWDYKMLEEYVIPYKNPFNHTEPLKRKDTKKRWIQ
jgi:murein DD-endopeptidase MepM/ murein hydrolase activator NlpD